MYSLGGSVSNLSLYQRVISVELTGSSGIILVVFSFKKAPEVEN